MKTLGLFLMMIAVSIFGSSEAHAVEQKPQDGLKAFIESKLVSREGQKDTLNKRANASTANKKKAYVLPDPDPLEKELEMNIKTLNGSISARSAAGMAVEFEKDEAKGSSSEIWVNFTKKIKCSGFRDLNELEAGDTVFITFKETKDQKKRLLKEIALVAKKPKEDPAVKAAAEAEAAAKEAAADVTLP